MQNVPNNKKNFSAWTVGSECNGGFAQYATIRSSEAFVINSNWTDIEIASIPCAYSTAEGLLHRAQVVKEKILIKQNKMKQKAREFYCSKVEDSIKCKELE